MDLSTAFISGQQLALIAIDIGLVTVLKQTPLTGTGDNRWAPLISLILGVGLAFLLPSATVAYTILAGLVIGLSASGAYSTAKTTIQG